MIGRNAIAALASALLCMAAIGVQAQQPIPENDRYNPARYPDWSGPMRFTATGGNRYDQTKRPGRAQQAPLTAEYQAIFDAGLKDQAAGGQGGNQTFSCTPGGMPREMAGNQGLEFVVTPRATHVIFAQAMPRRIYTDGRDWPNDVEPTFDGYSIGKWIDEDGDGKYDVLEVETRNFMGPHSAACRQCDRDQGAHLSRQAESRPPARRDDDDRQRVDAPLDRAQDLSPHRQSALRAEYLHGREQPCADRQRGLLPERRRPPDADQEEPGAARPAVFHAELKAHD
jgi:hypothetical protein